MDLLNASASTASAADKKMISTKIVGYRADLQRLEVELQVLLYLFVRIRCPTQ